jgi:hypothetical protein
VQFIFQIDGDGQNAHLNSLFAVLDRASGIDIVGLFDVSGGAGILPGAWPKPFFMLDDEQYDYHGYAGGLGPDNLTEQIPLITKSADGARHWIDMESGVRSKNDVEFDLAKVRRCLEIAKPFVELPR